MRLRHTLSMQIRLMLRQRAFAFCFGINMLYILATFVYYALTQRGQDVSTILSPGAAFALNSNAVFYPVFINAVPFITVLPFAMSFMTDRLNDIAPIIQSRAGIKNYYVSKALVCFIGGSAVFFIPLAINLLLNLLVFPQSGITAFGDMLDRNYSATITGSNVIIEAIRKGILFPRLYLYSADLYNLLFAFIFSLSMGVLSVFSFVMSFILKRHRILLFIPVYLIIIILNTIDSLLQKNTPFVCYKVMEYLSVNASFGKSGLFIFMFFAAIGIFSILMMVRQIKNDQI